MYAFALIIVVFPSLLFWIYLSTAYCSPFCLHLEDFADITDSDGIPVLAMAFGLTVLGVLSDVVTVTKVAGLLQTVNSLCARQ